MVTVSKIRRCDFCLTEAWWTVIKVRGKRFHYIPSMIGAATYKLELCNKCYENMKTYVAKMTGKQL